MSAKRAMSAKRVDLSQKMAKHLSTQSIDSEVLQDMMHKRLNFFTQKTLETEGEHETTVQNKETCIQIP